MLQQLTDPHSLRFSGAGREIKGKSEKKYVARVDGNRNLFVTYHRDGFEHVNLHYLFLHLHT